MFSLSPHIIILYTYKKKPCFQELNTRIKTPAGRLAQGAEIKTGSSSWGIVVTVWGPDTKCDKKLLGTVKRREYCKSLGDVVWRIKFGYERETKKKSRVTKSISQKKNCENLDYHTLRLIISILNKTMWYRHMDSQLKQWN